MKKSELEAKLDKSLDFLRSELGQIRTGRVSPALLDNVYVMAYDAKMTIKELASITHQDAQNLVVTPWDRNLLQDIAKAIRESDLKLSPIEEPGRIRVQIPTLTEERRKEFAKQATVKVEECKTALRNIRQEAMKDIEKAFSDKEIGEDEKFQMREDVEETLKVYLDEADELGGSKREEILSV